MQEILDINVDTTPTFDNYWSIQGSDNDKIKHLLKEAIVNNNSTEHYYLVGDSATGKSHLLQALAQTNDVLLIDMRCQTIKEKYLDNRLYTNTDYTNIDSHQALGDYQFILIDHLDDSVASNDVQHWLFNLFNHCSSNNKTLIIAANQVPNYLPVELADLKSRLQSTTLLALEPLNDEVKTKILVFRAMRQGLCFDDKTLSYLMNRSERDLHVLMQYLDKFNKEGLRSQKKLGISLIKETLNW